MTEFTPLFRNHGRSSSSRTIELASIGVVSLSIAVISLTGFTPLGTGAQAAAADVGAGAPSFADLIAAVEPAVVSVRVQIQPPTGRSNSGRPQGLPPNGFGGQGFPPGNRPMVGEGAGFFVSSDGYIVTANHVVANETSVEIMTADGMTYPAKVVGTDQATDVAVLKVDANKTFTYVQFADQMPRVGDWVVAIGNPYGLGETATAGIVSALARDLGDGTNGGYLQIDAPINEGNSGGPTFDLHGNVVGINDAIFSPSVGSVGIGFDVPGDTAKVVAAAIEKSGHVTGAWLGVQVQDVTQNLADGLGLKDAVGALISSPLANSPAATAGIKAGDVVVAVNGMPIKDARGLTQAIAGLTPGATVKLDVVRSGQSRSVNVTLGEMPAQPGQQ